MGVIIASVKIKYKGRLSTTVQYRDDIDQSVQGYFTKTN